MTLHVDVSGPLLGAAVMIAIGTPYVVSTLRGQVHPNRITWALWATSAAIGAAAQWSMAVDPATVAFTAALSLMPLAVVVATFIAPPGEPDPGVSWQRRVDITCAAISGTALVAWVASGATALVLSIVADGVAAVPTVVQAWRRPRQDSLWPYAGGLAAVVPVLADMPPGAGLAELGWPLYFAALNIIITTVLIVRRRVPEPVLIDPFAPRVIRRRPPEEPTDRMPLPSPPLTHRPAPATPRSRTR